MDKKLAKIVQDEAAAALQAIAEKHGFSVRAHGGTLGDIDMVLKFQFKVADAATVAAQEKTDFERYAYMFGLEPTDYRASFTANGKVHTIVAFDMKRRKFPIIAEVDGKRMCFTDLVADRIIQNRGGKVSDGDKLMRLVRN